MLDEQIRVALKTALREKDCSAAIFDELPILRGRGKADVAFVNGELCGFEIKSDADSLVRLGTQTECYQSVFEFVTLVAASKHVAAAKKRIPKHWGIIEAKEEPNGHTTLEVKRRARKNRHIDNAALARMLWKTECRRILAKHGTRTRPKTAIRELWRLAELLPPHQLCEEVRNALKLRRLSLDAPRTQCDDLRTTEATGLIRLVPHHHQ